MEIKKKTCVEPEEKGKTKGKFSRFKGMVDRLKKKAMVLAVVSAAAMVPVACSGPDENPDGGSTHDADTTTDSGTDSDTTTDSGGDAGQSLCDIYPDGHENRHTFYLGISEPIEDGEQVLMFRELQDIGGLEAVFAHFNKNAPTNVEFLGFYEGDQQLVDVPGVGETTLELCSTTSAECKWSISGNHEGDANCTATLASTRSWGSE